MNLGVNFKKAVICGDWHAHRDYIHKFLREMNRLGVKEVIHVGDVGFMGNIDSYVEFLEDLLRQYRMELYFIEGNHEDYEWLNKLERESNGLMKVSENIWHIPRGYRYTYRGKKIVFIGGGVSVDQHRREEGFDWWAEEELTDEQVERISKQHPADIMISHDCPNQFDLYLPDSGYFPSDLIKKSEEHRVKLGKIYGELDVKYVVCGHYHIAHEEEGLKVLDCNKWYVNETQYVMLDEIIKKVEDI